MNRTITLLLLAAAAILSIPWLIVPGAAPGGLAMADDTMPAQAPVALPGQATAIFAGGCFWCMEKPFDELDGVVSTTSGYTGGKTTDPTYRSISDGSTGHTEAVQVIYDPGKVSYDKLLEVFWLNHDPTTKDRQFCDKGTQYRPAIFPVDDEQFRLAVASREALAMNKPFSAPIITEITAAGRFHPAESYHQDYYLKNPLRYHYYRTGCGRDARLQQLWGNRVGS